MASSVQKLTDRLQRGLRVFIRTRDMLGELIELLAFNEIVSTDQLHCFPAAADCAKKTCARRTQLWQKTCLVNESLRNLRESNLDQVVISLSIGDVPLHVFNPGGKGTHVRYNRSRSTRCLSFRRLCAKLCSFSVLPPWDSNRCADTDNRKDGLNPSRLHFRFQRTPPNQLAIHATPYLVWGEA